MGKGAELNATAAKASASGVVTDDAPTHLSNFVNGAFAPPSTGEYTTNTNPTTGEEMCKVPKSGAQDVDDAVKAAVEASAEWGKRTVFERRKVVKKLAKVLIESAEVFSKAETADMGKVLASSNGDDLKRQVRNLRYHAEAASHSPGQSSVYETDDSFERRPGEAPSKTFVNYVSRHPIGVVAIVAHWSRPLHQAVWRMAPALVAGNAVVVKPPSFTPYTTYLLAKACNAAGIPPGVVNVVFGDGAVVGQALAAHPDVGALAMVGGPQAAAAIAATAAPTMKKLKFDLANNHAMVVLDDADLDALLPVVLNAAFTCDAGQRAHSLGRLILHESVAETFTARFVEATKALSLGNPLDTTTQVGPLVHDRQVRLMEEAVASLVAAGGKVLAGSALRAAPPSGMKEGGNWFAPTIVGGFTAADASTDAILAEAQGPVVKVITVKSAAEAVQVANAGRLGLSASVWSKNLDAAHSVCLAINAGYVWCNNWLTRDLSMPFGGWKESGNGQRSGGAFDVDFYSYTKTTCVEITGGKALMA